MAREYTRRRFYDLVWSKPITHVAKDFALSDVAIHKICRKHDIPTPAPGWWAKKQAGKPVKQTPLPEAKVGETDRIAIAAAELRGDSGTIATVREEARVRATGLPADDDIKPDAAVTRTIAALRKAKVNGKGLLEVSGEGLIRCEVGPESIDRLGLILTRVVAAAAMQGFVLETDSQSVQFSGESQTIRFGVTETMARVKHDLTASEQRELDAWEKKQERRNRQSRSSPDWRIGFRPTFPEWDSVPSGQLSFEMETVRQRDRQGPRSTFRDAKVQRLDLMAEDIAVALVVLAIAKREDREYWAERERVRQEERRIRDLPLRAELVSKRRTEELEAVLGELANLDRLRRLLSGLNGAEDSSGSPRVSAFLIWAGNEFAAREEAFSAAGLERRFDAARLFGDDDDHGFRSPYFFAMS